MSETRKEHSHHTEHGSEFSKYLSGLIGTDEGHEEAMQHEPNEEGVTPFHSTEAEEEFKTIIRGSDLLPPDLTEQILYNVDRKIVRELYAFAVDHESPRESLNAERPELAAYLQKPADREGSGDTHTTPLLSSSRNKGYVLACAFEKVYPDYAERTAKLRALMKTKDE